MTAEDAEVEPAGFFPPTVETTSKPSKKKKKSKNKAQSTRPSLTAGNTGSNKSRNSNQSAANARDRPMSARAKSRRNLQELDSYSLLMSGLKTAKEKKLATALQAVIHKLNDRDSEVSGLTASNNKLKLQTSKLETVTAKTRKSLYQEQKIRTSAIADRQRIKAVMAKIQLAVSARLRLLGIDFENITSIGEALDASLKAINSLVAQLQEKDELILQLESENEQLKKVVETQKEKIARLEKIVAEQKETISNQQKTIAEQKQIIEDLMNKNKVLNDENTNLKAELKEVKKDFAQYKKSTQEQLDALRKTILEEKEQNVAKDSTIADLEARIRELEALLAKKKTNINDLSARVKELEQTLAERDATIQEQSEQLAEKDIEIERLLAIINKPKTDTGAQTKITGGIDQQLSDYPRLLKEIVALKHLLDKKNQRIRDLEEENKQLMLDMQWLLKRAAAFRRDSSNHTGQVWEMQASPNSHIVATGSSDMTVRLWKCNPNADKSLKQKITQVFRRSEVDGKVESLCWSRDGALLAVGTGFRDGAEGYIIVWHMNGDSVYDVKHVIRSRPTTRFGRAMAITFSPNADYIYAGDTVGSIWCFSLVSETIVGLLQCHTDVVHDLVVNPLGTCLYSVGLDMALAVVELSIDCGGNKEDEESKEDDSNTNTNMDATEVVAASKKAKKKGKKKKGAKGKKSDRHGRTRSKTVSTSTPRSSSKSEHQSFASMSLKELLSEAEDDEYKTYDGTVIQRDPKYAYWKVAMSSSGKFVAVATRKPHVLTLTGIDAVTAGPNISDMDMEHIRGMHIRNGLLLISRAGCQRAKLFDIQSGKEVKKMKCKLAVAQADFFYDSAHVVLLQQDLVPNEQPKAPKMSLYCYDKVKAGKVTKPGTPKPKVEVVQARDDSKQDT